MRATRARCAERFLEDAEGTTRQRKLAARVGRLSMTQRAQQASIYFTAGRYPERSPYTARAHASRCPHAAVDWTSHHFHMGRKRQAPSSWGCSATTCACGPVTRRAANLEKSMRDIRPLHPSFYSFSCSGCFCACGLTQDPCRGVGTEIHECDPVRCI